MLASWRRVARAEVVCTLVVTLSIASRGGMAESTHAKCSDPTSWKDLGEGTTTDVCGVARKLMGTCHVFSLPKVDEQNPWYAATDFLPEAPDCACSIVMYNILSACAACQWWTMEIALKEDNWPSLSDYQNGGCGVHGLNETKVPWNNTVPVWSDELDGATFNLTKALAIATGTDLDSNPNSNTAATPVVAASSTPNAISPDSTASTTPAASTKGSNSGLNVGAIVGAVIGVLVLLSALGLGFWLHRRRRRARDVPPSAEFFKPEYYVTPPLLSTGHDRRASDYRDDIEEVEPATTTRHSWAAGLVTNRVAEEDDGDMLPPFTRGTYIGPSPHEKGAPERRDTGDSDLTMRTNTTSTYLLSSSPTWRPGPSGHFP